MRIACLAALIVLPAGAQDQAAATPASSEATVDRVVAVVNRQTISRAMWKTRCSSVLDPGTIGQDKMTGQQALDRLISRTLIQQQIRQEDQPATEPNPEVIAARITEMRNELPACVRAGCRSDDGWKTFLARHELTPARVESYVHNRLEILNFIEMRFRQGIRIAPEETEKYYRETLSPQYPAGQKPPPLEQVSSRIEEILLEQKVNAVFDSWLANLRSQGQIEVLDPALEASSKSGHDGAAKE